MKRTRSTNPLLQELVDSLLEKTREVGSPIWRDLAKRLSKSSKRRAEVNISRIARNTQKGDMVAVPGKVLGSGSIGHPVVVAAFGFSKQARQKILAAGGECLTFKDMMDKNPKGTNVKIIE
jgi:large subunit ribosomal protein L18e